MTSDLLWVTTRTAAVLLMGFLCLAAPAMGADSGHQPARAKTLRLELGTSAVFSPEGQLVVVAKEGGHVVVRRSDDEGKTWSEPAIVNAQPEAIAADGESRPRVAFGSKGSLLVSWARPLNKPYTGEIRLARSADGGRTFAAPITVHRDTAEITHRFESFAVGRDGRVTVAWIDKRDQELAKAEKRPYVGAAIYAAISDDDGISFKPEFKVADHSCECCRTTVTHDADGTPMVFWRHVFEPNERDHGIARLQPDGRVESVQRVTFDRWRIDACPHHGPSLVVDAEGVRHAVWFNQVGGEGHVFYGRLPRRAGEQVDGQRVVGGALAAHADLAVSGRRLAIVWKEFDGRKTLLRADISDDAGRSFRSLELGSAAGASDQPRALVRGEALFAFWRTEREGMRLFRLQ